MNSAEIFGSICSFNRAVAHRKVPRGGRDEQCKNVLAWHDDGVDAVTDMSRITVAAGTLDQGMIFGGIKSTEVKRTTKSIRNCQMKETIEIPIRPCPN